METKPALRSDFQAIGAFCDRLAVQGILPKGIAAHLSIVWCGIHEVACSSARYLDLPASLKFFAADSRYLAGLPAGRWLYRDEQEVYDRKSGQFLRCPVPYTREEIADLMNSTIHPSDPYLAATLPLAYNVGFVMGWLSGLSIAQKDDAQAGLVLLATLVTPLLLGNDPAGRVPNRSQKRLAGPSRKGSRSSRSRKK